MKHSVRSAKSQQIKHTPARTPVKWLYWLWLHDNKTSRQKSNNHTTVDLLIHYDNRYILPFTLNFSTEVKPNRPLNYYITTVGIWSPLGLSETAIIDRLYGSTEPFPQDGEWDGRLEGRLPSWGWHPSVPSISNSTSPVSVCFIALELKIMFHQTRILLLIKS